MTRPARIGFFSMNNPYDRDSFSGTPYYMLRALKAAPRVKTLVMGNPLRYLPGVAGRMQRKVFGQPEIDGRAVAEPPGLDFIVSIVSSEFVAEQAPRFRTPILHVTDATPGFIRESYDMAYDPRAEEIEAACLRVAAGTIYSSDFMAARARAEFPGLNPDLLHAFPFGLNLDRAPPAAPEKPPLTPLNLLFVGRDWVRKGGPLAVATLDALAARGIPARLTVIGGRDAEALGHPQVRCLGLLRKDRARDSRILARELAQAHLLLLPTRADCTPMVVAEANAYGCPVAVTDVGGLPSLVDPGRSGTMFSAAAGPDEIAGAVSDLVASPERYQALSRTSRQHFERNLTWDGWVRNLLATARKMGFLDPAEAPTP